MVVAAIPVIIIVVIIADRQWQWKQWVSHLCGSAPQEFILHQNHQHWRAVPSEQPGWWVISFPKFTNGFCCPILVWICRTFILPVWAHSAAHWLSSFCCSLTELILLLIVWAHSAAHCLSSFCCSLSELILLLIVWAHSAAHWLSSFCCPISFDYGVADHSYFCVRVPCLSFSGYLESRAVYFLMNLHIRKRSIYLTRVRPSCSVFAISLPLLSSRLISSPSVYYFLPISFLIHTLFFLPVCLSSPPFPFSSSCSFPLVCISSCH